MQEMQEVFLARRKQYAEAVEAQLERAIGQGEPLCGVLREAMRYAALGGGKRLRAMLVLEFCRLGCGDWARALPFAAAVEMVHAYSLIHDDLPCMDDDDMRRGKPSCHRRFGEANALLAGDALLTLAFESMLRDCDYTVVGYPGAVEAARTLAARAGADGMVGGQVIDLKFENSGDMTADILKRLHAMKTGALIGAACRMGAAVGGMQGPRARLCEDYAAGIGLAFQIIDDVLDETSTPEALGKNVGSDRQAGKTTYATLYGAARARELAAGLVAGAKEALQKLGVEDVFLYALADMVVTRQN